jgi:nucleotide-binding universal stress UspA family protein
MLPLGYSRPVAALCPPEQPWSTLDLAAAEASAWKASLHLYGDARVGQLVRHLCYTWPGLPIVGHRVDGDGVADLLDASRHAAMIVAPRDERIDYEVVAAHAHCPTIVVPRRPARWFDGAVVVGIGLRADDEPAIRFAFEEADAHGMPVVAVHVWSGVPAADLDPVDPYCYEPVTAAQTVDRMIAETLAGWTTKYPDVHVEHTAVHDVDVVTRLQRATGRAGIMVLGTNRHTPASQYLLGRTTRRILREAKTPVAVVRLDPLP